MRELTVRDVEEIAGVPFGNTANQCHAVSLAIVKSHFYPEARVSRGWCQKVRGQHSWVTLGWDCYNPEATIIDPTLWAHDQTADNIWVGSISSGLHIPHGYGNIWEAGRPAPPTDPPIWLKSRCSYEAEAFLNLLAPDGLDMRGWQQVAHLPVNGWPAREVIEGMLDTPELATLVPIDIVGMLTDRNPQGLYF